MSARARTISLFDLRIEENTRAVSDFGHGRGIGAGDGASAGHGFQDRDAEAFVERGEHETVAGVVEAKRSSSSTKPVKTDAVGDAGVLDDFADLRGRTRCPLPAKTSLCRICG